MTKHPDIHDTGKLNASVRDDDALRISTTGSPPRREHCRLVGEEFLTVTVEGPGHADVVGSYVIMCTPCDLPALAVGFLFSEGIIANAHDIGLLSYCDDDPSVIRVRLVRRPVRPQSGRNLIVASSCGARGSRSIRDVLSELKPVGNSLRVSASLLATAAEKTRSLQTIFAQTGGAHAAAIFSADGEIIAFAEDIGRHNALDKAIGKCVLEEQSTRGRGAFLSGRVSFELAVKAANAGIELVAAVSAPSSLAVDVARRCNITLCGFVRGDRATLYAHPARIAGLDPEPRGAERTDELSL